MKNVIVSGSMDDLRFSDMRFLQEAARLGSVQVLLWSDDLVRRLSGSEPKFPLAERKYFIESIRYVHQVIVVNDLYSADTLLPENIPQIASWVVREKEHNLAKQSFCRAANREYKVIPETLLEKRSDGDNSLATTSQSALTQAAAKVIVTGCYDWLHTGHIRFFEEAAQLGDLYVVVGNDENVRFLKGEGHPLFIQEKRQYMVQAIRYVTQALISTGKGWMDAGPEIERIKPDIYAVNEDGDVPEKREYCAEHGLQYVVLKRLPKDGLPRRESTKLRGF